MDERYDCAHNPCNEHCESWAECKWGWTLPEAMGHPGFSTFKELALWTIEMNKERDSVG